MRVRKKSLPEERNLLPRVIMTDSKDSNKPSVTKLKLSEVRSYLGFCKETQKVEVTPKNHPGFIRPKHNLFKMRDRS